MNAKRTVMWVTALFALTVGAPIHAADSRDLLPKARSAGGILYLTGGVGARERAALKPLAKDYNLRLTFIDARGAFLAFVQVSIEDAQGRVLLNERSDGPWFFVRVPPGTFRITATRNGERLSREVEVVPTRASEIVMQWPDASR
ncbi:MAG: hypothetical protein WDZ63_11980 [Burkholderiales bacterium]